MVQGATGEEGGQGPPRSGGDAEEQNGRWVEQISPVGMG